MGRILNRFSADLSIVDENLSVALFETIQLAFITASGFAIACVVLPIVTVLIPPILGVMLYLRQYTTASMVFHNTVYPNIYIYTQIPLTPLHCFNFKNISVN